MIIEARLEHTQSICDVIRQSITQLCFEDHHNKLSVLGPWLSNKTVDNCELWIENKESKSFVALEDQRPVGISMMGNNGYIFLCYVHPENVGFGIGKQLILSCEKQAMSLGLEEMNVDSSLTAKGFYQAQGFKSNGASFIEDNLRSYPLCKRLKP